MMRTYLGICIFILLSFNLNARSNTYILGTVKDASGKGLYSTNIVVLHTTDSSLAASDFADSNGRFEIAIPDTGSYIIRYNNIGYYTVYTPTFQSTKGETINLPDVILATETTQLKDVTITYKKPLIEVKADKVIFNVEGSINATGSNALELLRKSPGVTVDNNENIAMKGKGGVKIYIDGKISQLSGKDLTDFLKSISSNDIEAIEMISNPGAKYDAAGNAGIINFRLKKNKKFGTNGNAGITFIEGFTPKTNGNASLNYRNKKINIFCNLGGNIGRNENGLNIDRIQKDTTYIQRSTNNSDAQSVNIKAGIDYFINNKNTIGFLETANIGSNVWKSVSNTNIYYRDSFMKKLAAFNEIPGSTTNNNVNLNYKYADTNGRELNIDADNGLYRGRGSSLQPNYYYDNNNNPLYTIINRNNTPTDIDIYTLKADYEQKAGKGKLGIGGKISYVNTNNTYDFYNVVNDLPIKELDKSNTFRYAENINAAYINYSGQLTTKFSLQAGLRLENTISRGELSRADGIKQSDDTVVKNYIDLFPSGAITFIINKKNSLNLTYSRRIDRPTYQDLNPFINKIDELTFEKGNAFLKPQYTNIIELTHTFIDAINTTISYSNVQDFATQIADTMGNATYIQQRNLGTQQVFGINIASPIPFTKWWNAYLNMNFNYQMYDGKIGVNTVKQEVISYGAYLQQTFTFPRNFSAEVTCMYNGPAIWAATWHVQPLWGVDFGLQKQIMNKNATIKLSITDAFFTYPWSATSDFGGLKLKATGNWESRTLRLSFSYRFGSSQVSTARDRKTGLENESNRIKGSK